MSFSEYVDLAEAEDKFLLWLETPGRFFAIMLARGFKALRADYDRLIGPFVREVSVAEACAASRNGNLDVLSEMDLSILETGLNEELWRNDEQAASMMACAAFRLAEREMARHRIALHGILGFRLDIEADPGSGAYACKGGLVMRKGLMFAVPDGVERVQDGQHHMLSWRIRKR